jgi:uncharacterized protein (TIGR02996 family)
VKLRVAGEVYWVESRFDEKDAIKAAGFLWHSGTGCRPGCGACAAKLGKVWWTRKAEIARTLLAHGDDDARRALGEPAVAAPPRDDLLGDVLANPDDDAPRQVLADALIAKGDPRGEMIRLQLENAPSIELIAAHEAAWLAPISRYLASCVWRRGFLDEIRLGEPAWRAGATEILALEPVRKVTIEGVREPHTLPELARVRVLSLPDSNLGPDAVRKLVDAAPGLRGLWLEENPIGDEGLAYLAKLKKLEELELAGCAYGRRARTITPKGMAALVKAPFLPNLKLLGLRSNTLEPECLEILGASRLSAGATLDLSSNFSGVRAGKKGAAILLASKLPRLRLDAGQNHFSDEAMAQLAERFELVERWRT